MGKTKNQLSGKCETVTKVGPKGEIANANLINHSKNFTKRLVKITDGVYQVIGVGLANTTMIEGENGIIIVDTGDGIEEAEEHLEEFRKISDKPVTAIIYTHWHYTVGTRAYVPEGQEGTIEIWSHELVDNNFTAHNAELKLTHTKKAYTQFGLFLPAKGPDAFPNLGLGSYFIDNDKGKTRGYVKPNRTVSKACKAKIDGINVELIPTITDTNDGLIIWLPDKGVAINNVLWGVFPNIGALRGDTRDPKNWINSIKELRALKPSHIIGVHGVPIFGSEECEKAIEEYHDGMQFVYDQTVRGINLGLTPEDLVEFVKLPHRLKNSPILQPFYGEVENFVRGTYAYLIGWYGNDTAMIHPVSKKVEAEKMIKGFGGPDKVLNEVRNAYEDDEFAWAAQLITYVLKLDPNHKEARQLKALALRKLAETTPSSITRNFYLTQVFELEGKISPKVRVVKSDNLSTLKPEAFMHFLRVKLDPVKSEKVTQVMRVIVSDSSGEIGLQVRRGLAEVVDFNRDSIVPDLTLKSTCKDIAQLLTSEISLEDALRLGNITIIKGDIDRVVNFFALFDEIIISNNERR
ncbi:linear primary-alkylsulfatase [Cytobacillus horneckiae]|uniref:alkyl sulfatase dimerization domain-containing protein n=1 Tax=Cytobacillus horneckiae TaxID=549687 RepID=UPI0019CFBF7B|nr:MBL fold metallo-hydrolase [Cytobacillus horneckiae]